MEEGGKTLRITRKRLWQPPARKPCTEQWVLVTDPQPAAEHASFATKAKRLRSELTTWAKAGMKLVPRDVRRARLATCSGCKYWAAAGNWGLGECRYPGCGCTRAKAFLATSRCPGGFWKA